MYLSYITASGITMENHHYTYYMDCAAILLDRYSILFKNQTSSNIRNNLEKHKYDGEVFSTYLKLFQHENKIKEDGKLGPVTWRYLFRIFDGQTMEISTRAAESLLTSDLLRAIS